jgi:hypothetical protein
MSLFFYSSGGYVQIWMINFGAHSIVFIGHFGLWYMGLKKPLCKTNLGEDPRYVHKYVYMSIVKLIVGYVFKIVPNIFVKHLTIYET